MLLTLAQRGVVDQFAELQAAVKKSAELGKQIRAWCASEPADAVLDLHGDRYTIQISACSREREISDMPGLFDALGCDRFLKIANVRYSALDGVLSPVEQADYITEKPGSRRITAVVERQPKVLQMPARKDRATRTAANATKRAA